MATGLTALTTIEMTLEDWFNLGKADALCHQPKLSPEQDPEAASFYDLGYAEGSFTHLVQRN